MSNVQYSFVSTEEGHLTFRSSVNSFGLDHVTDKDMVSFYTSFSNYAYIDTGLMPVDGSGLLALRSAGNHTQIVYQHKPGMYYINWGSHEGDKDAVKYYVAQPYRIVIADLVDGNIYGARTFYTPIPVTYPDIPLYHVNLPNINCKGYRGNAVGWICLYHTEDITNYPFGEKLAKVLDRCSGTEAYNDINMNETDGPRFYSENKKPSFLHDPFEWQEYSHKYGYEWTLDPDLWIPVLVKNRDDQGKHDYSGQPLTLADAITGNYSVYYSDTVIPKPVNQILRSDYSLPSSKVFAWFKQAYNSSTTQSPVINVIEKSQTIKVDQSNAQPVFVPEEDVSEEDVWYCDNCQETFSVHDCTPNTTYHSAFICAHCFEDKYVYALNTNDYHHAESENMLWLAISDAWIYLPKASPETYKYCSDCDTGIYITHQKFDEFHMAPKEADLPETCLSCYEQFQAQQHNYENSLIALDETPEENTTPF